MPFTHLRTGAQQTLQSQIDDAANVYKAEILKNRKSTLYGGFLQEYTRALTFEIFFLCPAIPHLTCVHHAAAN